jgi:hypothetical protein
VYKRGACIESNTMASNLATLSFATHAQAEDIREVGLREDRIIESPKTGTLQSRQQFRQNFLAREVPPIPYEMNRRCACITCILNEFFEDSTISMIIFQDVLQTCYQRLVLAHRFNPIRKLNNGNLANVTCQAFGADGISSVV